MRICLVAHGFPPLERTGVENYTATLARELAAQGHRVDVFVPRRRPDLPEHSLRREERDGYAIHWLTTNVDPRNADEALDRPGVAERFGDFLGQERPELVHFQHVIKLGIGLIGVAREHGLPALYTAHDYYPVCHRYTLLRPDLERCDVLGDSAACARCDLAVARLNQLPELGDYQMGAFPEQLPARERERLGALLDRGDAAAAGFGAEESAAALQLRTRLDERRREAYGKLDRIIAPSRFLASQLERVGLPPATILPYGIDVSNVADVPPIARSGGSPLRIGFLGGLSKHKGAHVLLEAWKLLGAAPERATLSIWGYSGDRPYVDRLRARAAEVGAQWRGSYDNDEVGRILTETDVVVVPSLWVENYPIVIREALAAGRPVITSRLGALPESVRDGVDGLLAEPGDAASLAAALGRCVEEEGLVERLAAGIEPVHGMAEHARELVALYEEHLEQAEDPDLARLPESLRPFLRRHARLSRLPNRELFDRALARLDRLREGLGGELAHAGPEEILRRTLAGSSRAQILLRDKTRESRWMHATRETEEKEVEWLRSTVRAKDAEIAWLRHELEQAGSARERLEEDRESTQAELDRTRRDAETALREVEELAERGERSGLNLRNTIKLGLTALRAQEHVLGEEVRPLLEVLRRVSNRPVEALGGDESDLDRLVTQVRNGALRLADLEAELDWRRREMHVATQLARRKVVGRILKRTGLGRRTLTWDPPARGDGAAPWTRGETT